MPTPWPRSSKSSSPPPFERQLRVIDHDQDGSMERRNAKGFDVGAASRLHRRRRRRWKEHAHRPPAPRFAVGLRGSDQLVEKASKNRNAGPIDFSLFTDGLKAEREQGI
jgi:hypothetical protein